MELKDEHLIEKIVQGDKKAFSLFIDRYEKFIFRLAFRLLQSEEEAEDVTQEVLIKVWEKAHLLPSSAKISTWLYKITTNHCLNILYRRKIVRFVGLSSNTFPIEHYSPFQDTWRKEKWSIVMESIKELSPRQQTIIVLSKFENLSAKEIAKILNIKPGAVDARLFRALKKLSKIVRNKLENCQKIKKEKK